MGVPNLDLTLKNGTVVRFDEKGRRMRADFPRFRAFQEAEATKAAAQPRPGQPVPLPGQPALVPIAETGGFSSFSSFLSAVKKAGELLDYRGVNALAEADARLFHRSGATPAGGSEIVPADGGFLIQPQWANQIWQRMTNVGQVLGRCTEVPVVDPNRNGIRFPQVDESSRVNGSRWGGVFGYWQNEANQALATKPKFLATEMKLEKLVTLIYLSSELADDSDAANTWASLAFAQESVFNLESKFISGTGAGQPLGVLNAGATITVPKETDQAAGTIVAANVLNMASRLWAASRPNAIWLYSQAALPQLLGLSISVGSGGSNLPLFHFSEEDGSPDMLCGMPCFPCEYCSALGAPGDLILGDWSRYVVATKEPDSSVSIHVRFLTDEQTFRFVMRVNGQPVDPRPVAAANSTATTSSFLVLAQR